MTDAFSFPSGHTAAAFGIAVALYYWRKQDAPNTQTCAGPQVIPLIERVKAARLENKRRNGIAEKESILQQPGRKHD